MVRYRKDGECCVGVAVPWDAPTVCLDEGKVLAFLALAGLPVQHVRPLHLLACYLPPQQHRQRHHRPLSHHRGRRGRHHEHDSSCSKSQLATAKPNHIPLCSLIPTNLATGSNHADSIERRKEGEANQEELLEKLTDNWNQKDEIDVEPFFLPQFLGNVKN
ncbi:hypothetical protein BHM03_00046817 [Ensete ventricosum]|nr:hypothetical protein BHM03_00046817 [Ensete ventricosum]